MPPEDQNRLAVIGVATYRRPALLAQLLELLPRQLDDIVEELGADWNALVVLVDNDPEASAAAVAREHVASLGADRLLSVQEREPGIAAVRNRVLAECDRLGAEVLLFIDDDETPEPGWASSLVRAWRRHGAAGVSGKVVSRAAVPLDPWVAAGGFFDRSHRHGIPDGDPVARAATNNLLVDLAVIRSIDLRFDTRYGFSGGEDSMFTGTLVDSGYRIVWCPGAVVLDHVPADRATREFVLRRTFSLANNGVRVEAELAGSARGLVRVRARAVAGGAVRLAVGVARRGWGELARSDRHRARGARAVARGLGELSAVVGVSRSPYSYGRARTTSDQAA